jgi:hypothetical protein
MDFYGYGNEISVSIKGENFLIVARLSASQE